MDVRLLPESDRLEVTPPDSQRFIFPFVELQARRRAPRPSDLSRAADLPSASLLRALERARRAAEEYDTFNDLI